MINDIRYHVDEDEDRQMQLEQGLAAHMHTTFQSNINAFQRNIPSLLPLLNTGQQEHISPFCNKSGQYNLVDIGLGKVLYGPQPEAEIKSDIELFLKQPLYIPFDQEKPNDKSDSWECLVVLGCGIGYHIEQLLTKQTIKYLIIYEPEVQYFTASARIASWKNVFAIAKAQNTTVFLQIGKDGRDLVQDMEELQSATAVRGFYLYKHYNHVIFDQTMQALARYPWQDIEKNGLRLELTQPVNQYVLPWNVPVEPDIFTGEHLDDSLKKKNLAAFKRFFPGIHKHFAQYEPNVWRPVASESGQVNIQRISDKVFWYSPDPKQETAEQLKFFARYPHKDGLVLSYTGKKLLHYEHYKFLKKTEKLLEEATEGEQNLPDTIPSIIIFGIGSGYQLEQLREQHEIEKIFLVEPNRDFFFASLYAIDWSSLLEDINASDQRIYINIGDDGNNLVGDLMNQFTNVGPYLLNQTYFLQGYYNARLNEAIANLREQLRIMICMGEYFDHALYGINQTNAAVQQNAHFLKFDHKKYLSLEDRETPVFIVGNGPSIDAAIDAIKEYREQVIVISCGTALKVLHSNGITPDFQAEIEQNRTTFDWASIIEEPEYLANISLLSCNGIHPDTMSLYKDTYLAFKKGESSTAVAFELLGKTAFAQIEYAFPTVSNLAVDFVTSLGFTSAYLFGVDLGFADQKHHHSKLSGYYEDDGKELYDYSESNQTSLVVPGNFRDRVFTKLEFKLSKQMIEKRIAIGDTIFYNCSDGARVQGATPLAFQNILLLNSEQQQKNCIAQLKNQCFTATDAEQYHRHFSKQFSIENTLEDFDKLKELINERLANEASIDSLPEKLKILNFSSYERNNSLFFYYMYGSVNFFSAALAKIRAIPSLETREKQSIAHLNNWNESLNTVINSVAATYPLFDNSKFQTNSSDNNRIERLLSTKKILLVSEKQGIPAALQTIKIATHTTHICADEFDEELAENYHHIIICETVRTLEDVKINHISDKLTSKAQRQKVTVFVNLQDPKAQTKISAIHNELRVFVFFSDPGQGVNWINHKLYRALPLLSYLANQHAEPLAVSKLVTQTDLHSEALPNLHSLFDTQGCECFDFGMYLCFRNNNDTRPRLLTPSGTRGRVVYEYNNDIVFSRISTDDLRCEEKVANDLLSATLSSFSHR